MAVAALKLCRFGRGESDRVVLHGLMAVAALKLHFGKYALVDVLEVLHGLMAVAALKHKPLQK